MVVASTCPYSMQTTPPRALLLRFCLLSAALITASPIIRAQNAPAASPTDPATLAKYDKNNDGRLDADELSAMQAAEEKKGDAVLLNPFQVNTSKDRGYAAGNTLSGSRADTPLAITPASISV